MENRELVKKTGTTVNLTGTCGRLEIGGNATTTTAGKRNNGNIETNTHGGGYQICPGHPLLNSLIVSNVFNFLGSTASLADLRNFRSVCRVWNVETLRLWRSKAAIRLGPPERSVKFRNRCVRDHHHHYHHHHHLPFNNAQSLEEEDGGGKCNHCYLPINEFIRMVQDPQDPYQFGRIPFSSFVFLGINLEVLPEALQLSPDYAPSSPCYPNFWNTLAALGVTVESFKFEKCAFSTDRPQIFEEILTKKLNSVRKLILRKNALIPSCHRALSGDDMFYHHQRSQSRRSGRQGYTPQNPYLKILEVDGDSPIDAFVLLLNSPNLETLRVRNIYNGEVYNFMILDSLYQMRSRVVPFIIRELDVMESRFFSGIRLSIGRELRNFNLRLEKLSLTLEPYHIDYQPNNVHDGDIEHTFTSLLRHFRKTLKVLQVFRPPVYQVYDISYPFTVEMTSLRELHLWGNVVNNFTFLRCLPALEVLNLNNHCFDKRDLLKKLYFPDEEEKHLQRFRERYRPYDKDLLNKTPFFHRDWCSIQTMANCELLQTLNLDCTGISVATIELLAAWIPNLKVFRANFARDTFRAMCKWMPCLEEVVVLIQNEIDDNALTGREEGGGVHPHNITALKRLKRFQLKAPCNKGTLSNEAVYQGFLKMTSLQHLHICVSKLLTAKGEAALRAHIAGVTIMRNYGDSHFQQGNEECCQFRLFFRQVSKTDEEPDDDDDDENDLTVALATKNY